MQNVFKHLKPGHLKSILQLLILQALLLRVSIPFAVCPVYFGASDPARHFRYATEPLFSSPMGVMDAPLYQIWMTIVNKLSSGDPYLLAAHSAILSFVTPWLWYLFLKEALPNKKMAILGFAIIAWLPSWMGIFSYFMPETILLPLLGLSLWTTYRAMADASSGKIMLAWFFWMLTVLAKVVALPAALIACAWMIYHKKEKKSDLLATLICISLILLCPIAYHTNKMLNIASPFGFPELTRIYFDSGKKLIKATFTKNNGQSKWKYIYQSPSVDSKPFTPLSDWTSTRSQASDAEIEIDLDKGLEGWLVESRKNKGSLEQHWRMLAENAISIIFDRSWPDETNRKFLFLPHDWLRFLWAPLLVLVLAGNMFSLYKERKFELLPTIVTVTLLFFFFLPAAVGEGRYRKPLEGLLISNALWLLARRNRKYRFGKREDFGLSHTDTKTLEFEKTLPK